VTPPGLIPLTGDGGSLNPPPPFVSGNAGWWNVEPLDPSAPLATRETRVRNAEEYQESSLGPYAAFAALYARLRRLNSAPLMARSAANAPMNAAAVTL